MIYWLTGNTGAGKTTLAYELKDRDPDKNTLILDGDEIRYAFKNFDLSETGRWKHNLNIAKLAQVFEEQGFNVVVSVICPYEGLRQEVKEICDCTFVYLPYTGDDKLDHAPYEPPKDCLRMPVKGEVTPDEAANLFSTMVA